MGKQQPIAEVTPEHNALIDFYSNKYYKGEHKDKIKEKIFSSKELFDNALADIHNDKYKDLPYEDFRQKYVSTYGDPFPEKKKPLQSTETPPEDLLTGGKDSGDGSLKDTSSGGQNDFLNQPPSLKPFNTGESIVNTTPNQGVVMDMKAMAENYAKSEQWEKDRKAELEKLDTGMSEGRSALNAGVQGLMSSFSGLPKSIAIAAKKWDWFDEYAGKKTEDLSTYKFGNWLEDSAKELFPTNPKFQDEFLIQTLPQAAGNLAGYTVGGFSSKMLKMSTGATVATLGATQIAAQEYQNALAETGDEDKAFDTFLWNLPIGAAEGLPWAKFLKRLDNSTGGGVKNFLLKRTINSLKGGTEEMVQEITSNSLTNVVASKTYDETRNIFDGAIEQGAPGFILGTLLTGLGLSLKKKKVQEHLTPEEVKDIEKAEAFVEEKLNEIKEHGPDEIIVKKPKEKVNEEVNTAGETTENIPEQQIPVSENVVTEEAIKEPEIPVTEEGQKLEEKSIELKSLEEGYNNKSVDELVSLKKKLYPSPDIESAMSNEEKLLDKVIAKKYSDINEQIRLKRIEPVVNEQDEALKEAENIPQTKTYESGSQKYAVKKGEEGIEITNETTGQKINRKSKAYDKVLASYKEDVIPTFKEGKKAVFTEAMKDDQYLKSVIETSENPEEIATAFTSAPEGQLGQKDQIIKDSLRKLPYSGIQRFGDTNKIKGAAQIKFNYVNNNGTPLDVQAMNMSENSGVEITPQDLIDFIERYPNGTQSAKADNSLKKGLSDKFFNLTGISLDEDYARKIAAENKVYDSINRDLPDDILDLLASEGITNENIDQFKEQYFSGFPFTEEDFELVKQNYHEQQTGKSQEGSQGADRTGKKSETSKSDQGVKEPGQRRDIESIKDKARDARDSGDPEKAKAVIKEIDGILMRENIVSGDDASFADSSSPTFFDFLDQNKSVYLLNEDSTIAQTPEQLQEIISALPESREIDISHGLSFDDAFDTGVIDQAKKMGYDGIRLMEIDGTNSTLQIWNFDKLTHIDGPKLTGEPPVSTEKKISKEGPKKERRFPKQIDQATDIQPEIKENLTEKTRNYTPISNVQTVEEANNYIKDANIDDALSALKDKKSDMSPRVRVALGQGIIKKANKGFEEATTKEEKNHFLSKAVEAAEFTSEYLTELGQGVQAAAIFGKLSWEGLIMHIQNKIKTARSERIKKIAPDLEKKRAELHAINEDILDQILQDPKYKKIIEEKLKKASGKLKKKGVDKAIDILEKLKIDTKGKAFDALYGLTAHSVNLIITAIQKSLKAGSSVVNAINHGINEYKKTNKEKFNEDLLREDLYEQLKGVESEIDPETAIKRGLKDMGTNIKEIVKKHYTQADTAKRTLIEKLVKDANLDEADAKDLANQINEAFNKLATTAKEKALKSELSIRDKVQPKITKSIDDKLIELTNLGALSQEDFNKIYSEKLGIKELSNEDIAKLKELSDTIQEADTFAENTKENFNKENIEKHLKLQKEKQKALNQISDIISDKAPKDVWDTLSVILQGNLLSPMSIVTNVYSNVNLMPLRFLSRLSAQGLDKLYSKITGKPTKIDVIAAMKGYNVGAVTGSKQGWEEFRKGSNVGEINKADIQRSLKPWKSLLEGLDPSKLQTLNERISNLIEGTFGFPAEGMFRSLTLGDRPFQRGAEYAKAFELASLKGLEGEALDKFIMFPDAESAELIRQAGEDATFKQTGGIGDFVAKGVTSFLKWLSKIPIIGGPAKFLLKTQIPYVKTPVNILVETMDYALPQLTFLKSLYYASKKDRVKSFEFLGKTIVGIVLQTVATELFKNSLLSGDPEKEKKERALQHQAFPPNGLNISGYLRLLSGGDPTPKKTDMWIGYEKMGVTGAIFSMKANQENTKVREGKKFDSAAEELLYDTFTSIPNAASTALELGPLQGTNTFLDAVKSGDYDTWISNTLNAITSVAIPNTITAFNRASRTNLPELRDPDLMTRLSNVMKGKVFMGDDLPSKVDLWGNKIKQTPEGRNPWMYHLFDVTKNREIAADQLSFEIYKLWRESNSAEAIPAVPSAKISYEGEKFKLNAKLYELYQMEIGQTRAALVRTFIESDDYKSVDTFEKIDMLKDLYEEGFEYGKEAFWEKYGFEVLKTAKTK